MNELRLGFRLARALVLGVLALASCGKTSGSGPGSGETHFLRGCEATCGGGYECLCGVCTKPCDADSVCSDGASTAVCTMVDGCATAAKICDVGCSNADDCAELGDGFSCSAGVCRQPAPTPTCAPGCFPVTGYPRDVERSCADLTRGEEVTCQCGEPAANSSCFTRVSDGSVWMVPDGQFQDAGWEYCSGDVRLSLTASCDFADCAVRPNSFCSFDDTCSGGCGSFQQFPDGCARAVCEADGDCPADDRCVMVEHVSVSTCTYSVDGTCNCGGPTIDLSGAFCNPTSETGPRGEWQSFEIASEKGMCSAGCLDSWIFTPDGTVSKVRMDEPSFDTLGEEDLELLKRLIDGPELRRRLRDDEPCVAEDLTITFTLNLPDQSLAQEVTSCLPGAGTNDAYGRIWEIAQKY